MGCGQGTGLLRQRAGRFRTVPTPIRGEAVEHELLAAVLSAMAALVRVALKLWEAIADRRKEKRPKHKGPTR